MTVRQPAHDPLSGIRWLREVHATPDTDPVARVREADDQPTEIVQMNRDRCRRGSRIREIQRLTDEHREIVSAMSRAKTAGSNGSRALIRASRRHLKVVRTDLR